MWGIYLATFNQHNLWFKPENGEAKAAKKWWDTTFNILENHEIFEGKAIKNGYVGKGVVYGISNIHSKAIPFLTCLSRATPQIHGYLWKIDQRKWMQKPLTVRMIVRIITTNHQHVAFATAVAHLCAWTWDFIVFFFCEGRVKEMCVGGRVQTVARGGSTVLSEKHTGSTEFTWSLALSSCVCLALVKYRVSSAWWARSLSITGISSDIEIYIYRTMCLVACWSYA